jgi:hypothetical protein
MRACRQVSVRNWARSGSRAFGIASRIAGRQTVGYQLLWINQVALVGTEQLASTDFVFSSGIDASGDSFYHGAAVGLQYVR